MPLAATIKRFLEQREVSYDVLKHPRAKSLLQAAANAYVSPRNLARAAVLKDERGLLMAVFPASHVLDLHLLNKELHRGLTAARGHDLARIFHDCEPGALPPIAEPYGLKAVLDESLQAVDEIYFVPGRHSALVHVSGADFQRLHQNAWRGLRIARAAPELRSAAHQRFGLDIKRRLERIDTLPAMPEMALRILQLRRNPYANARLLAQVVELDPSLAAQILRYARSPFFGYRGNINSIHNAISRVLGYDTVLNIALGIALGRPFRIPRNGPLGLDAYWRHSIYSAALAQTLGNALPYERRPRSSLAYLAGLLHDFGYLVLGHLFEPEFFWLNRIVAAEPETPAIDIEQRMLGATHGEIGAWALEAWRMPEEIVIAAREHHNAAYRGVHALYANLVFIADRLLEHRDAEVLPPELLRELDITVEHAQNILNSVLEGARGLDAMVAQMTG